MAVCRFPGCAAEAAPTSDVCSVHVRGGGELCVRCHGSGRHHYAGQNLEMACEICGGIGLVDRKARLPRKSSGDDPVSQRGLIRVAERQ